MVIAIATALSGIAVVSSLLLVLIQLNKQSEEEFVSGTATTFEVFVSDDFQRAVQWVLYELHEDSWRQFVVAHRGRYGERALIRVGAFYNRIGYLVTQNLLGGLDGLMLDAVAGQAIAVWQKIEPLVLEARLIENSMLFQDFQRMLPECYECYVPSRPTPPIRKDIADGTRSEDRAG
jgi:hypothetical protein